MNVKRLVLSVLAGASCLGPAMDQPVLAQEPPDGRYRIVIRRVSELDPEHGGPRISGTYTTSAFVALRTIDTVGGRVARLIVDSLHTAATGAALLVADTGAQAVVGEFVQAHVVEGRVSGTPSRSLRHLALNELLEAFPLLFPGRPGETRAGASWADTVSLDERRTDFLKTGRRITQRVVASSDDAAVIVQGQIAERYQTENWRYGLRSNFEGTGDELIRTSAGGAVQSAKCRFSGAGQQSGNGAVLNSVEIDLERIR